MRAFSPLGPGAAPAEGFVSNAAQYSTVRCSNGPHVLVQNRRPIIGCWGTFSTANTLGTRRLEPRGIYGGLGGSAAECGSTSIGSMHVQVQSGIFAHGKGSSQRNSGGRTKRDVGCLSMSGSVPGKGRVERSSVELGGQESVGVIGDTAVSAKDFKSHKRAVHRVIFMRHGECEWNRLVN